MKETAMLGRVGRRLAAVAGAALILAALLPVPALAAGAAAKLAFGVQPANTAAGATMATVTVQVEDSVGAVVTGDTSAVTIAIGTNAGGGTLTGTLTQNAVNGIATFNDLSINNAGIGYTLAATDGSLAGATSAAFTVIGPASKLAFGVQPSTTVAGNTISPAITVKVEDANGSVVTSSSASVGISILSNPSSGILSGTLSRAASAGVATFNDLSINSAGVGYTLVATSTGLTGATSAAFTITGPAYKLAFGTQPSTTVAGVAINPSVTVQVQDSLGNVVTGDSSNVTIAIGTNPATGTLGGTLTHAALNGVATFSNLSINNAGNGYTLQATDGSLTSATSSSFNIVGTPAKLAFGVQPANTATGATISPPITVKVEDTNGNVVASSTASITLAIGTNAGPGTLGGTATVNAVNGVATFNNVFINGAGNGYTLTAASSGLTGATSSTFNITNAYHLAFITQPGGGSAGAIWSQQPVVEVLNSLNQVVTSDNTSYVYLAIGTNPASGTLSCTSGTSLRVTNGVATFSGCSIDLGSASPYTLSATSNAGYAAATSSAFYVGTSAYHLAFVTQPGGGAAGAIWSQQPVVAVENSSNQVVTSDSSSYVYLAIATNPAGGTLTCTGGTTEQVVNGYAYFSGCSINLGSASAYTLSATSSAGYTAATSSAFYVGGTSEQLVFVTQPGGGAAGTVWSQQPVVAVENTANQVMTTDNSTIVYLSIGSNPASGTLSCTGGTSEQVVNGYAYFSGCSINAASTSQYTLSATSNPTWTPATSAGFYVTGAQTAVALSRASAIGVTTSGPYSLSTKVVRKGAYITIKITTSPAMAGADIGIWIAKKVNGVWTNFSPHTGRIADSQGVVYYYYKAGSLAWLSFRARFYGDATHAPSWSDSVQARWIS
jgi:hypothetical protein